MLRKKMAKIKQKIICIPIIIILLMGFVMPNYVHANMFTELGEDIGEGLIQLVMIIPDAIITFLHQQLIEDWR